MGLSVCLFAFTVVWHLLTVLGAGRKVVSQAKWHIGFGG